MLRPRTESSDQSPLVFDTVDRLRAALSEAYPNVSFTIAEHRYPLGSRIRISWTDGPIVDEVEAAAAKLARTQWNPKAYRDGTSLAGSRSFHADRIVCMRHVSPQRRAACIEAVVRRYQLVCEPDNPFQLVRHGEGNVVPFALLVERELDPDTAERNSHERLAERELVESV